MADERLTRAESSTRTKQKVQFVNDKNIPTRLGTILRKGDKKYRECLLDESNRTGWGYSSTSSTSETDWPGPGAVSFIFFVISVQPFTAH